MAESDSLDNITEGKYVYWMSADDDIPRGHLGEVVEVEDEHRKVNFPNCKYKVHARKLNVSDIQKDTFVHFVDDDYDFDAIGEVKDLDDGKLVVEIKGEQVKTHPKYCVRCDFQPDMYVFWTRSDDDIPPGHMGTVLRDLNDKGMVKVKFPNGSWRFKPSQMVRAHVQPGSYVQWTKNDDDIAKGEIGQIVGELNDEGRVKVQFAKGSWRFKPEEMFLHEMQWGSFVTWSKHDSDIDKGDVGQVIGVKVEEGRLRVTFPRGTWTFKANELKLHKVQPGMFVHWTRSDEDIPRGCIGEVVRMKDSKNRMAVQWPKGIWSIKPAELHPLPFQKGDRVQWTKHSEKIPEGDIGTVLCIRWKDDGDMLYVRWSNGQSGLSFKPSVLKPINLDADSINQLKAAFKRFDKNGDGKLSVEELTSVLGNLGDGEEGLSEDECQELFAALDKDNNGKLTANEFIDYVFGGDASGSQRKLLGEGFGLEDLVGITGDENENDDDSDDDNPNDNSGGGGGNVIVKPPPRPAVVAVDPAIMEGIGPETEVSRAEWASALLAVGVCRQAALESFDGCQAALGKDGELTLEDLSGELNGIGGGPGVEELREVVGKVKCGTVSAVDLDTPAAECDAERELAVKTGIDGLLYHLSVHKKPLDEAAGELQNAKLSELETQVLESMGSDALVEAVKAQAEDAPVLSTLSSWQRARENCRKEVNAIIEACAGEKYVDDSWNPLEDSNFVMYVDKEKPGWDCTVSVPAGWQHATEIYDKWELVKDGASFHDIRQGHIGDCFLMGALGSLAANRRAFFRQAFAAYDMKIGVYGILMNVDSHFTYVIVDDVLGKGHGRRPEFGRSTDDQELWVSILEKAFFKYHTCLEMCDGGHGPEAMFCFMGGLTGRYDIGDYQYDHPEDFFKTLQQALTSGELTTGSFREPSKGPYAEGPGGEAGQCGEVGLPYGLHGGHCYSVLRTVEAHGNQLLCFRNPWAKGEWTGPWGDKSDKWTDEMKEACGLVSKTDGVFWMAVQDYVQLSKRVQFARTFGPAWQTVRVYGRFSDEPTKARAKKDYQAQGDGEFSLKKGDTVLVSECQGYWSQGVREKTGEEGFFRTKDVQIKSGDVQAYEFSVDGMADDAPIMLSLMRENQLLCREWVKRKEDGMNYKNKKYPKGYWFIFNGEGKRVEKHRISERHVWTYLPKSEGPWSIYINCPGGQGKRFSLQGFAPHGSMKIKSMECSYADFLDKCA